LLGLGDLVFEEWGVITEYDGGYHFDTDQQIHHDIERLARFADAGWTVVRVHKLHLRDPRGITTRIRAALTSRGWVDPSQAAPRRRENSVM
jgi:very-short-patch-repair endonuclease